MRFALLSILFFLSIPNLTAQVDNTVLERNWLLKDSVSQELSLDVHSFTFFRNYEYFNDVADGLTYFGLQISPVLTWQANENLLLYAGAILGKDFGNDGIRQVKPLIGIKYQKNGVGLIAGALEATVAHHYLEPLMDYDLAIVDPIEYGVQLKFDRPVHRTDLWINWENMIYKPSSEPEEITGGVSSQINLFKSNSHSLSLPIQALFYHIGGQIDTLGSSVVTYANVSAGFGYSFLLNGSVNRLYTQNHFLLYRSDGDIQQPFTEGKAIYLNIGAESKWLDLMISYWKGDGFYSPMGAPVFQSVSSKLGHKGEAFEHRNLLFFRLIKNFTLAEQLKVSGRFEPVIDMDTNNFDCSMSLFLTYRGIFNLKKGN